MATLTFVSTASIDRERDSAELPELMRRDVRLLGDVLGEVISESDGPDLLADVERLRHAVIERPRGGRTAVRRPRAPRPTRSPRCRRPGPRSAPSRSPARSRSTSTWSTWPKSSSGCALCGCADSGDQPPRESLADTIAWITDEQGRAHLAELLAGLRVHPVFTAHPTEARRRAVVASLRRVSGLLAAIDDQRAGRGAAGRSAAQLREEVDLLWRTAQLRVAGMTPADEVRTVMTAFDETLFRLVPAVYRALDQVLLGADSGAGAVAGAAVPAVRLLGGRRPGRQP